MKDREILYKPQIIIVIIGLLVVIVTTTTIIAFSFFKEEWSKYPEHTVFVEQRNRMITVIYFSLYIYLSPQYFLPYFYLPP